MLKISLWPACILPATGIDNSEVVGSSGTNSGKLAKSDFIKPVCRAEEFSFLALNARQAFTQLRQAFIKTPNLQYFDIERYIQIKTDASSYNIGFVLSQITSETD